MCRVAGRILRPFISTRELASIAVKYGTRNEYAMNKGFLARRVPAWKEDNQSLSRLHTATKKITSCARAFSSLHGPSSLKCTTPSPVWMGCLRSGVPSALGQEFFREFLEGSRRCGHITMDELRLLHKSWCQRERRLERGASATLSGSLESMLCHPRSEPDTRTVCFCCPRWCFNALVSF